MTYEHRDVNVRKHDRKHPANPYRSVQVRKHSRRQRVVPENQDGRNYLMAGRPPADEPSHDTPQRGRIIWSQISMATKMAVGARDVVVDDETGYLHFRITKKRGDFRKIIVQLTPMDSYDVKLVNINRKTFDTITEHDVQGIYAEDLSSTIYDMVHETGAYRPVERKKKSKRKVITIAERDFERGRKDAEMGIADIGTIPNDGPEYEERLNSYMRGIEHWEYDHGGVRTWQHYDDRPMRRVPQSTSNPPAGEKKKTGGGI